MKILVTGSSGHLGEALVRTLQGWEMFNGIDRVYVNDAARKDLGWRPKYSFSYILKCLKDARAPRSELAAVIGSKGYHS